MVASRNQMHMLSRAFGSSANGSLPAYGAAGEMNSYLNGRAQVSMRGMGAGPKPMFAPSVKGEVMDQQEVATKFGWGCCLIVRDNSGYYVVQVCKPGSTVCTTKSKHPTMAEAKKAADKCAFNMRNSGKATSMNGLGGLGGFQDLMRSNAFLASAALLYIGAGMPGAESVVKQVSKTLREPKTAVQNTMMAVGLTGMAYMIYTEA